jgi:short-subunit dehydrogenase
MFSTLITGASSGIGEAFARKLAADGKNLVLVARSEERLATICNELGRAHGIAAQYVALDLTQKGAPLQVFEETARRGLRIEMLINNAGFGAKGEFAALDLEHQLKMIELNITALVALTHYYLGPMRKRRKGAIINVASTSGFQSVPYTAVYAATKAFVLSFSEALWEENRAFDVKVMALCPGVTETNFFAAAGIEPPPMRAVQSPEAVVAAALKGLERGRSHVISGWSNFLLTEAQRFMPRSLVTRMIGRALRPTIKHQRSDVRG